ncbi:MAG: family 16 glycosylhydrolase [Bacteroidetes bacterium]|nr:family 16 glycosylhydrolase [Bacteroidota bacterium]
MKNTLLLTFLLVLSAFSASCKKDNQPAVLPKILLADVQDAEGNTAHDIELTVQLEKAANQTVTVDFQSQDGSAKANEDYLPVSGKVTFAPQETTAKITVSILADSIREGDEVFYVVFSNPENADLPSYSIDVKIVNDDNWLDINNTGYSTPATYVGYDLLWADEFAGASLNTGDWGFDLGDGCSNNCGWGNNELEYYTDTEKNVLLINGHLVIEAHLESKGGRNYTSTRMKTQGKKSFQYGRIDIRAKLPEGQGIWPALWMLGEDITSVGWPACGEIDIMEYLGHETNKVYGTGHWGPDFTQHGYKGSFIVSNGAAFNEEFHVFSVDWKENEIVWLMDDQPYFTLTPTDTGVDDWAFNKPFFFIFNMAVGGNWPGNPDNSTTFPQRMIVDYVRVFEKQ